MLINNLHYNCQFPLHNLPSYVTQVRSFWLIFHVIKILIFKGISCYEEIPPGRTLSQLLLGIISLIFNKTFAMAVSFKLFFCFGIKKFYDILYVVYFYSDGDMESPSELNNPIDNYKLYNTLQLFLTKIVYLCSIN